MFVCRAKTNISIFFILHLPFREIWNWEKWKHELVLWRTSWCFMFFFHGYSMLSPNILSGVLESIKIDKNFIWSLLELENAITEILHWKKGKHELVLWRTSWCFMAFLWPLYDFTKYFVRAIRFYQDRPNLLKLQKAITEILHWKKRKHELVLWRTSWCFL